MGQPDDRDVQRAFFRPACEAGGQAVLIVDVRVQPRHDPKHRHARQLLQLPQPRPQQFHVSAEFVDHRPDDPLPLFLPQQGERPVKLGEHAAAVNVPCQQHGRVHQFGKPHVDDVVFAQVDLRRGACALNDDDVVFLRQAVVRLQDLRNEAALHFEVVRGIILPAHFAHHNQLAPGLA